MFDINAFKYRISYDNLLCGHKAKVCGQFLLSVQLLPGEYVWIMSPRKSFLQLVKLQRREGCPVSPLFPSLGVIYLMFLTSLSLVLFWLFILNFDIGVVIFNIYVDLFIVIFFR